MKNYTSLAVLFCLNIFIFSGQNSFWGVTTKGGDYGQGVIFQTDNSGTNFTTKYSAMLGNDAKTPGSYTQLTEYGNSGVLYGVTKQGGLGQGVLFKYDPSANIFTKLVNFNGANGTSPEGGLLYSSNQGKFYGTTLQSNADGSFPSGTGGALFEFDPVTDQLTVLYKFDGTKGQNPYGKLYEASNGNLYGTASGGGASSKGVLFQYVIGESDITVLHSFAGGTTDGANPYGGAIEIDNKLYGGSKYGGTSNYGTIYEYNLLTSSYSMKVSLGGSSVYGSYMTSDFVTDGTDLYAVTNGASTSTGQYGTIIKYTPATNVCVKKHAFSLFTSGGYPMGGVVLTDGVLIGNVYGGPFTPNGAIFEYNLNTSSLSYTAFSTSSTEKPIAGIALTSSGELYGYLISGGNTLNGGIYVYDKTADPKTITIASSFINYINGINPVGKLTRAANGKLYGNMSVGGANASTSGINTGGVLFSFDPVSEEYVVEYDFPAGSVPNGSMVLVNNRLLYGMSEKGGDNDKGYIFEYNTQTQVFTIIASFNGSNGSYPKGGFIYSSNGRLYGTASQGGSQSGGTLFSLMPTENGGSGSIVVINSFSTELGGSPYGDVLETSGSLFCTTYSGPSLLGSNQGTISKFGPMTTPSLQGLVETNYMNESINEGYPVGSLTAVGSNIYGTTHGTLNDNSQFGVVFKTTTSLASTTILHQFIGNSGSTVSGAKPVGKMTLSDNNKLYGFTSEVNLGGAMIPAYIFELDPSTDTYSTITELTDEIGNTPSLNAELALICATDASVTHDKVLHQLTANQDGATYQWYELISPYTIAPMSGEDGQTYTVGVSGTYCVEVTYNGCSNLSDYYYCEGSTTVASNNIKTNTNISIYPNPASEFFKFSSPVPVLSINIIDVSGKILKQIDNLHSYSQNIDVKSIHSGVYFISFVLENNQREVIRFIKR